MFQTILTKDLANKKINVEREFFAPLHLVWKAWTDHTILDKWWAPKPWRAETKEMSFKPGGFWLYSMVGPDGNRMWAKANYHSINEFKNFTCQDNFCDENGAPNSAAPSMFWNVTFQDLTVTTKVVVEITFEKESDLQKIVEMGFQEGFTMAHGNLDEVLGEI